MINKEWSRRELYGRLYISALDLQAAREYAVYLIKKGWHSAPYERRGSIYMQQSAFTTSLVVSYARPFTKSREWPPFPEEFRQYSSSENNLHEHLMNLRNKVCAHSDSSSYAVEPWRVDAALLTDIRGAPFFRLSKTDCELVVSMTNSIRDLLKPKLAVLQRELADEQEG